MNPPPPAAPAAVSLADGRRLELYTLGEPDAPPVIYCHGTPGSRYELLLTREALRHAAPGLRLVAINRPGYGHSTWIARPGFAPWATDAAQAADQLGIGRFAVLGASGGAPFALACAQQLPDRVSKVAIVAGVAPPDTPGMSHAATIAKEPRHPTVRRLRYSVLAAAVRLGAADRLTRRVIHALGPTDRAALSHPDAVAALAAVVAEGFAQHGRAAAHEAGLFQRPWDFDLAHIHQPVHLWHGGLDTRIPARVAPAVARQPLHATATLWPDHGHFSWAASNAIAEITAFLADLPPV